MKNKWHYLLMEEPPVEKPILVVTSVDTYHIWNRRDASKDSLYLSPSSFVVSNPNACYWEDEYGYWESKDAVLAWREIPKFE